MSKDSLPLEACVICKRDRCLKPITTVIGPVCRSCFAVARPETAPYWAESNHRQTPGQATTRRLAR